VNNSNQAKDQGHGDSGSTRHPAPGFKRHRRSHHRPPRRDRGPIQAVVVRQVDMTARWWTRDGQTGPGDPKRAREKRSSRRRKASSWWAGKALFKMVKTGIVGDTDIEITEGVKDGDEIIIGSYRTLRTSNEAQPVRGPVEEQGRQVTEQRSLIIIRCADLWRTYQMGEETIHALRGVSFEIQPNEYLAIMGPSGSGKSTLMNLIGCLDTRRALPAESAGAR
jgi:ABC-type glutathione transport system ATPase component